MHPDDNPYAEHDHKSDLLAKISTEEELLARFPGAEGPCYAAGTDHAFWHLGDGVFAAVCGFCGHVWERHWQAETRECPNCAAVELAEAVDAVQVLIEGHCNLDDTELAQLARDVDALRQALRAEVHRRTTYRLNRRLEELAQRAAA